MIADLLPIINRFPHKPLIYNGAWKTTTYFLIALLIHYLERAVDYWREAGDFVVGNQKLLSEIVWPHFWGIQIVLAVLIFNYCVVRELARVIGAQKVRELFFGPAPDARA